MSVTLFFIFHMYVCFKHFVNNILLTSDGVFTTLVYSNNKIVLLNTSAVAAAVHIRSNVINLL